jgi:hypothetical protein
MKNFRKVLILVILAVISMAAAPAPGGINQVSFSEKDKEAVLSSVKAYWQAWFEGSDEPDLASIQSLVSPQMFNGREKPIYDQLQSYQVYGKTSAAIDSVAFSNWQTYGYSEEVNGAQQLKAEVKFQASDVEVKFFDTSDTTLERTDIKPDDINGTWQFVLYYDSASNVWKIMGITPPAQGN